MLPDPVSLGLSPLRYPSWRPGQPEVVEWLLSQDAAGIRFKGVNWGTGGGKCHPEGVNVLLYDGTVKNVSEIRERDVLMGPDSQPRVVLATHRGEGVTVSVIPVKGTPWPASRDHVLSLVKTNRGSGGRDGRVDQRSGVVVDVPIEEWERWPESRKHVFKLLRPDGVVFPPCAEPLLIPPRLLGMLLGDGSFRDRISFTKADRRMLAEVQSVVEERWGLKTRVSSNGSAALTFCFSNGQTGGKPNRLREDLTELGLMSLHSRRKFVPRRYLVGTSEDRLALLSGLLDTDGSAGHGGYSFSSASQQLAEDVCFLARSLGLAAYNFPRKTRYKVGGEWFSSWRVSISGDCSRIPCLYKRVEKRQQKKNVLRTGFRIERRSERELYFGFEVSGDGRYLLGDFTVTHNSAVAAGYIALTGRRTALLMGQKQLQDQYQATVMEGFDPAVASWADLRGQANYHCVKDGGTCDQGSCHIGEFCKYREEGCHYYDALAAAQQADVVVTNYAAWLSLPADANGEYPLGTFGCLVLDEGDSAMEHLGSHLEIELFSGPVRRLDLELPKPDSDIGAIRAWAQSSLPKVMEASKRASSPVRIRLEAQRLGRELGRLSRVDAEDWVMSWGRGSMYLGSWMRAEVVRAEGFGELLFRNIPDVVLMSATLSERYVEGVAGNGDE